MDEAPAWFNRAQGLSLCERVDDVILRIRDEQRLAKSGNRGLDKEMAHSLDNDSQIFTRR